MTPTAASDTTPAARQSRACQVCAISKAKCMRRSESANGKCERCERLDKECLPGRVAPRRPRRSRRNATAQIAEKLDTLVSLLATDTANVPTSGVDAAVAGCATAPMPPIEAMPRQQSVSLDIARLNTPAATRTDAGLPLSPASNACTLDSCLSHPIWKLPPDDQLQAFRKDMASYFPFIIIPDRTTAKQLRDTKPFLYVNIMTVMSYQNVSRQSKLRDEVMRSCAEQVLLQGKKSLDLLQGMVVFAAWYHHHLSPSPQLTNMIQLAIAMVFDLGLHRTQSSFDGQEVPTEGLKSFGNKWMKLSRTLEERRTFLGLSCLSRGLSNNIGKMEPLLNTPYVEECCAVIAKHHEYSSDRYLLFLVRFQNVADAPALTLPHAGVDNWSKLGTEAINMLVNSFQRDLEQFKDTLEPQIAQNTLTQMHLSNIAIHNTEIALRQSPAAENTHGTSNPTRLALLMTCLQSTRKFFDEWFSLPPNVFHHLPITVSALVAHATMVLGMLNFLQCEGWDLEYVREVAPFIPTVDRLAQRYELASRETDNSKESGFGAFCRDGVKLKRLRAWYDARLHPPTYAGQQGVAIPDTYTGFDLDLLDDAFWSEMIGHMPYDEAELSSSVTNL